MSLYGSSIGRGKDIVKKMEEEEKRRLEQERERHETPEHIERELDAAVIGVKEAIRKQILEKIDHFNWKIEVEAKKAAVKQETIKENFDKKKRELEEKHETPRC